MCWQGKFSFSLSWSCRQCTSPSSVSCFDFLLDSLQLSPPLSLLPPALSRLASRLRWRPTLLWRSDFRSSRLRLRLLRLCRFLSRLRLELRLELCQRLVGRENMDQTNINRNMEVPSTPLRLMPFGGGLLSNMSKHTSTGETNP